MVSLSEIEAQAMELSVSERATLASRLLHSLSAEMDYNAEGLAECIRREAEMEVDPSMSITLEELKRSVGR